MRVLFITPRFPYPPLKGDSLRVYHQIRTLSTEHRITLLSIGETPVSPEDRAQIERYCERVEIVPLAKWRAALNVGSGLAVQQPLQVRYYQAGELRSRLAALLALEEYDIVHATLIRMLPYVWNLTRPPIVVDLIDSLSLNLADRRGHMRGARRAAYDLEYRRVTKYERAVVEHFPALVVSSDADRQVLGGERITVIPNGVDADAFAFREAEGREAATLIFTGNMAYHPNEEAVLWFAAQVWPSLRAKVLQMRFQIVGTNPTERVKALHSESNGIDVLGRVDDVAACLGRATIAVAPMRSGSGIQNKVLEAMSTGTPVVATSIANRGVGGVVDQELLVADDAGEFADAVLRLIEDATLRERLGLAGRRLIEREYRWESHARRLAEIYTLAVSRERAGMAG